MYSFHKLYEFGDLKKPKLKWTKFKILGTEFWINWAHGIPTIFQLIISYISILSCLYVLKWDSSALSNTCEKHIIIKTVYTY